MGNETSKLFFKIAVSITLLGIVLYFVQEIIDWVNNLPITMPANGLPATMVISDVVIIITIILAIMLLFMGLEKTKLIRITIIMGTIYLLAFTLAHALVPFFNTSSWSIPGVFGNNIVAFYFTYEISFINLLLLGIIAIFVIIISMAKMKQEKITTKEKITYIVMLGLIFIFDVVTPGTLRAYLLLIYSSIFHYGFFMLPYIIETILIAFAIILLTINILSKEKKIVNILGIILLNIFILSMISTTVITTNMDVTFTNYTAIAIGNYLLILGAVLTSIATIIKIKNEIPTK